LNPKFKLKICTFDNEPIMKAQAERIEDFDSVFTELKKKFKGGK
jgi:hypothetical protein